MLKSRVEDINFYPKKTIRVKGKLLDLSTPKIMGIINCTPDSFYKNSRFDSLSSILSEVEKKINEGADIIDLGGYSSRPNAENVSVDEEIKRIIPIVVELRKNFPELIISIDTFRGKVADEALSVGADIINDIGAFNLDSAMLDTLIKYKCPYILMHMKGNPQNMQKQAHYDFIFKEIVLFFSEKIKILLENGINDIILDPGFGFAKTMEQNYSLLEKLQDFSFLNHPILVGVSRKSMIYNALNTSPEESLNGTSILNTLSISKGASFLRVHDVKEAREIITLMEQ